MSQLKMIWQDFGVCDHLERFGTIWKHQGSSGSIWADVESSAIIWDHMCPSRLTWDRLGSSWIIWNHLRIHVGSPGGTIWEETHLEGFWEELPQLMRKHHSATVCSTSIGLPVPLFVLEGRYQKVLYMVGIGCEPPPKMHKVLCLCIQNDSATE